ncbi:glutathione hydrolase 1 proenzyme-like isoform X2 [Aethina tumida]|uniref:glutathione hydrolase 1 proenzyme-like isoform X2 n=1 Tax=Aethina tumida TaxID=116153 RepID=UPI0021481151|nr:glutathione hydrolase 1 proenzyme-like isoform X2 [Aethina tumida]
MTITSLNVVDGTVGRKRIPAVKKKWVLIGVIAIIIVVLVILLATGVIPSSKPQSISDTELKPPNPTKRLPPSASKLHILESATVCADSIPCAEIGSNIFKQNGSAMDATIATLFCNGMVTMQSMGLGGGFLMTIYTREDKKAYSLNAREKAPMFAKNEDYNDDPKKSQTGPLSIGVPGELRGYWEAHKRFGKLSWKQVVQPTVDLCLKGYNMTAHQHNTLVNNKLAGNNPIIREWLFNEDGTMKKIGDTISPKKLCETYKIIAETDGNALYNGSLSKGFLQDLQEAGSKIVEEDLYDYEPEWQTPINVELRNGDTLYSAPPPGSGLLLAFILKILDGYNFNQTSIDELDNRILTYHRIIEAFKYAYAKRTELGDMSFVNVTELIHNLTSTEYADSIRMKIKDNFTSDDPKYYGAIYYQKEDHGTSHMSVIAPNGDAVSVTSSVNIYYGSGIVSNHTGIIYNSVMDDFSFPNITNYFGLPGSPNNAMKPGKAPLSSMTPSILVRQNGDVRLVVGASGGTKITTAIAQVIMRTLWFGENIKEAVDAPRLHHQVFPKEGSYEYGFLQQEIEGLQKIGHHLKREPFSSIVCGLLKDKKITGNADHRKGGEVFGI